MRPNQPEMSLYHFRTSDGKEVDFIIGDSIAIEIKTTNQVAEKHLKGLKMLQEENICTQYFLVSFDKIHKMVDNINIIYWEDFLDQLWAEKYL